MMAQGELGFKYEGEQQGEGMTGMVRSIERHVKAVVIRAGDDQLQPVREHGRSWYRKKQPTWEDGYEQTGSDGAFQ